MMNNKGLFVNNKFFYVKSNYGMGAVVSGAEQANNAAMFSTTDTVKMGFSTLNIADKARAAQQAQDTAIMRVQDGSIGGGGGGYGNGYPMMFTGFNHFLYVIGYLLLGLGAVAFCVTYFVEVKEAVSFGLSTFFFFFLIQHIAYFVTVQMNPYVFAYSTGVLIFMLSLLLGFGLGAMWSYAILPAIDRSKGGDIAVGVIVGIAVLFTLVTFQNRMAYGGMSLGMSMGGAPYAQQPYMQQQQFNQPMGMAPVKQKLA